MYTSLFTDMYFVICNTLLYVIFWQLFVALFVSFFYDDSEGVCDASQIKSQPRHLLQSYFLNMANSRLEKLQKNRHY